MEKDPNYDTWTIIFNRKNEYVGYSNTSKEADDICIKNPSLSWDFAKVIIQNKSKQKKIYNKLQLLTVNNTQSI